MRYALSWIFFGNLVISTITTAIFALNAVYFASTGNSKEVSTIEPLLAQCFISLAVAFIAAFFLEACGFA